ncbi:MAG TPA: DUF6443 domain-containing protein [Bacteroidia bacterium]
MNKNKILIIAGILFTLLCNSIVFSQSTNQNFIKKTIPVTAVTSETSLNNLGWSSKIETINYFDGLGRPVQSVLKKGSPNGKDLVEFTNYDEYGRTPVTYLPYADNTFDGSYKTTATAGQASFYTNTFMVAHTNTPYSETVFDESPLNKVKETSAPDTDWQIGNGHTTKMEEGANVANEVRLWQITGTDCISSSFYNAGELTVTKLTDPNGADSYTYKDKLGNTILYKKLVKIVKTVYTYAYTYFVHDDFGNVAYIISPKAYELMVTNGNYSVNALTQDLVYKYKYDERNRLVERKIPGTDWHYVVYNRLNQVVLTQDGNLRAQNKWNFIKYDVLGRVILTGLFNASSLPSFQTRSSAQTQFNATQADIGESEVAEDVNNPFGYTNVTLPNQQMEILSVNYYDDYDFDNNGTADYTFDSNLLPCITFGSVVCTPLTNAVTTRTRGYLTGTKTKVLDASNPVQWITVADFYNPDGLLAQTQGNDHMGATNLNNYIYDFTGNLVHSVIKHTLSSTQTQIINHFTYDRLGRLTRVDQKNNNDSPVVLSKSKYNELGQLIDKSLHSTNNASSFIQSIDYRYNIHGWLTHINNSDLSNDMGFVDPETGLPPNDGLNDDANDLWGMQLNYNTTTTNFTSAKQYGGNVSETHWRSASDNIKRGYGYTYDKGDRLTASTYTELNNTTQVWGTNANRYNENSITYDVNGNILTLKRTGYQTSTYGEIDNLTYTYNGNMVTCVNDASALQGSNDFKDNGSTTNGEYTYDANGNLVTNGNKTITGITYNHLNLPTVVNFSGGNKLEYFYDAKGNRLRKKITQGATVNNVQYAGAFEYYDNVLSYFHTAEGRCVPSGVSSPEFKYEYQYTDNTGNVVLAFSDLDNNGSINTSTEVIQQNHYYAFGMRMQGTGVSQVGAEFKYKFSGKEFQDEFNLNEYDFGARNYDPAIARWTSIDPLADLAPNWTPFRYGFNNPITITDPTGMFEEAEFEPGDPTKKSVQDNNLRGNMPTIKEPLTITINEGVDNMQSIQQTSLNLPPPPPLELLGSMEMRPTDLPAPTSEEVSEYEQPASEEAFEAISKLGDQFSNAGDRTTGAVVNALWNINNDVYVGYNWIVNRSMKDLTGHSVSRKHAQDAAFTLAVTILSLPIGGIMSEGTQAKNAIAETRELWQLTDEGSIGIKNHKTWGKFYKGSDGLWWSEDITKHGSSKFKVFQENNKGLEWIHNADKYGDFIKNQHKSPTGTFIPWGQFKTIK